ncbi:LOW QUALITY PROTEIN: hypothetical protein PHMEG_00033112 [Phytophthora megakarya]|uniref:Uncharacterized protein n=1 Tax=Phytophthora megakarya TaxID=4795 RepID=A0A225UWI9_9STRA|nr:LOW QUALITY PROTEIN: hypothetical protein PHMEG_00033112 [Phytophthora megakarya]
MFASEAEAEAAIHAWTKEHKFNIQLQRKEDAYVRYMLFARDQAGNLKNTRKLQNADRQRTMRRSKLNGIVALNAECSQGPWQIRYTRDGSRKYNHP